METSGGLLPPLCGGTAYAKAQGEGSPAGVRALGNRNQHPSCSLLPPSDLLGLPLAEPNQQPEGTGAHMLSAEVGLPGTQRSREWISRDSWRTPKAKFQCMCFSVSVLGNSRTI